MRTEAYRGNAVYRQVALSRGKLMKSGGMLELVGQLSARLPVARKASFLTRILRATQRDVAV